MDPYPSVHDNDAAARPPDPRFEALDSFYQSVSHAVSPAYEDAPGRYEAIVAALCEYEHATELRPTEICSTRLIRGSQQGGWCPKCAEGTIAGTPTYCTGPELVGYGAFCQHRQQHEHLMRPCSVCGFALVEDCKDRVTK